MIGDTFRRTVTCESCAAVFRMEPLKQSNTEIGYCPSCGSADVSIDRDTATDYFEQLQKTYNLPIFILKEMFAAWDMKVYKSFGDYIKTFLKEVA